MVVTNTNCTTEKRSNLLGIPVSFDGVESRSFEPLPVGRYPAKVSALDYNPESARSGEPTVAWEFTVSEGEYANRKAFLNTSLQKQALWSTMRILIALGYSEAEVKAKQWDFEDPETVDEIVGRDCIVSIGHRRFEGEKRQQVRRVLTAAGGDVGGADDKAPF